MKATGRGFAWTKKEEEFLKYNYSAINKHIAINKLGRSWGAIKSKAKKLGIKMDPAERDYHRGWTKKEEHFLKKHYYNDDLDKIASNLGRTHKAISERAKVLDIKRNPEISRKKLLKYDLNEHFFKTWTSNMAYILGLICADGNITQKRSGNRLSISLHKNDEYLIRRIYDTVGSNREVFYNRNNAVFSVESKHIYNDLINLGITPAKSRTLGEIKVPLNFVPYFLLGVIDGDGSVRTKSKRIKIVTASGKFAKFLCRLLDDIGVQHKLYNRHYNYKETTRPFYSIVILRKASVKRLYNLMYYNHDLYLTRKHDAFKDMGIDNPDFEKKCKSSCRPVMSIDIESGKTTEFDSIKSAAEAGFHKKGIYTVLSGRADHYNGYKWTYIRR